MAILDRIRDMRARRAVVSERADAAVARLRELVADLVEVPGYRNVGLVVDHDRATVDGRVGGTMVIPRIEEPARGTAFYEFEIRQNGPNAGTVSVRELDRAAETTFVYGSEPRKGREQFADVVGRMREDLTRAEILPIDDVPDILPRP